MPKCIKIAMLDGAEDFEGYINRALQDDYEIIRVTQPEDNPDLVIYSVFGNVNKRFKQFKRLWISGENNYPNFEECDYAISCHALSYFDRHLRVPFFTFRRQYKWLKSRDYNYESTAESLQNRRNELLTRKFCSAVISNCTSSDPRRKQFYDAIHRWKQIDSAGRAFNNIGKLDDMKLKTWDVGEYVNNPMKHFFISNYKFNLAFENSDVEGYVTEKITDAFAADTIPIYFGTSDVKSEFNEKAFINVLDYPDVNSLLTRIKELDENDDLYMEMLTQPKLGIPIDSSIRIHYRVGDYEEKFNDFLDYIVRCGRIYERRYGWMNVK